MTVTINGTTGIAGTNGSAGTPAVQGEDTNTGLFFPAADTIAFAEGGAEVARFDSSGNLLVGTTAGLTNARVDIRDVNRTGNASNVAILSTTTQAAGVGGTIGLGGLYDGSNSTVFGVVRGGKANATSGNYAGYLSFDTVPNGGVITERARIDASGNLLVGTETAPTFAGSSHLAVKGGLGFLGGSASTYYYTIQSNTSDFYIGSPTLTRYAALFSINSFTAWSFGSDRRIKDNIEDLDYGLETVLSMRPRQYTLKDNDQFSIGFVAQELKDVVPEAVTGEEVPFEDSDTPQERASKTMGVSKETLIPILVKAIQELTARVAELEAK